MSKSRVLFLCTGNSARSQMAEGLVNHFLVDTWEAFSAGTKPSGYVHPLAVQVMAELGIDLSTHRSKSTDEFRNAVFDRVITVCGHAARNCPAWLGQGVVKHIGFPDPAAAKGSEGERLAVFRQVRDGLREEVFAYLQSSGSAAVEVHLGSMGEEDQKYVQLSPKRTLP
jgi:arsenate reductase